MRLQQLHYLLELYRTRSFSKAAENVFITQPSLSTAISSLEDELEVRLFERSRTGVYPTPIGEEIIKIASEIVQREERIYEIAKGDIHEAEQIHVLSIPAACHGILLQAMQVFKKTHPQVGIFLREMAPQSIIGDSLRILKNEPGTFTICSLASNNRDQVLQRLKTEDIEATYLYTDKFVCIISSKNPLSQQESISYEDFISQPEIDLNLLERIPKNDFFYDMQVLGLSEDYAQLKVNTMVEVDSLSSLKHLVMTEVGISVMPSLIVYKDRDFLSGDIRILPIKDIDIPIEYYVLKSNQHPLKQLEGEFLDEVNKQFQNIDFSR